jgi:hypothetical protein
VKRRSLLFAVAMLATGAGACGSGSDGGAPPPNPTPGPTPAPNPTPTPPPPPGAPDAWSVDTVALIPGTALAIFDLSATLPADVKRGGTFAVDPRGAPLLPGVTLTPAGMLSVSASASAGSTAGVVFSYAEPA